MVLLLATRSVDGFVVPLQQPHPRTSSASISQQTNAAPLTRIRQSPGTSLTMATTIAAPTTDSAETTITKKTTSTTERQSTPTNLAGNNNGTSARAVKTTKPQPNANRNESNNNKNKGKKKQQQQEPWKAGYYTSVKTQAAIKKAATTHNNVRRRKKGGRGRQEETLHIATNVLQTFLTTPPNRCNAANLVCALTYSAKLLAPGSNNDKESRSLSTFAASLSQTLEILQDMMNLTPRNYAPSSRQLCNAIWAIAKICDKFPSLLGNGTSITAATAAAAAGSTVQGAVPVKQVALSSDDMFGIAEEWKLDDEDEEDKKPRGGKSQSNDLNDKNNNPQQHTARVIHQVVDEIAIALTAKLQSNSTLVKNGELCMACWAYGILRQRNRPPGWKTRPRLGQVPIESRKQQKSRIPRGSSPIADYVRFEQWDSSTGGFQQQSSNNNKNRNVDYDQEDAIPLTVIDILFDEIAVALSQPVTGLDRIPELDQPKTDEKGVSSSSTSQSSSLGFQPIEKQRIDTCRWSELANVAWAFANRGWSNSLSSERLLSSIANETVQRLQKGLDKPASRDIPQIIWSLGIAQSDNFRLADSLIQVVETLRREVTWQTDQQRPLADWSCADLVQVALSLAHARLDEQELLLAIYQESMRRLPNINGNDKLLKGDPERQTFFFWEITILLWAQARLHLTEAQSPAFERFVEKATSAILTATTEAGSLQDLGLGHQEKANLAWSLVVLKHYKSEAATDLISRIFLECSSECNVEGCMLLEHAHQMWQALFLLEHDNPQAVAETPVWFRDYLQSKWKQEKARPKLSSARHRALSQALSQMGVAHLNEHDEDIDVAIVLEANALWSHQTSDTVSGLDQNSPGEMTSDGIRVAVEFDGPNHFTRQESSQGGQPPRSLGHSILKYRLLKKQGWNVIRVPYYEFDKIPFWASMERQRYLQRLLKTHSVLKFSDSDYSQYQPHIIPDRKSRFD